MPTLKIVDITPRSLSGDTGQKGEPNLAVNPENPDEIVATAFTPDPMDGPFAPIYVSTDGGDTWVLRSVVPGAVRGTGTADITVGFAPKGGTLYAGILNAKESRLLHTTRMQILRTPSALSTAPMQVLVQRDEEDQPWVVTGAASPNGNGHDRVYVGSNDFGTGTGRTATVDVSDDARTAPAPSGFAATPIERRGTSNQDGPPVRVAAHPDGTVYAAFASWQRRTGAGGSDVTFDVVVTRDDSGGVGPAPFADLTDSDGLAGRKVATRCFVVFDSRMGQQRLGGDLSIAVDPTDSGSVWVAWCDRVGGPAGVDNTLHLRHSADRGRTWSDARTAPVNPPLSRSMNPALAVNSDGLVGLLHQEFVQDQWRTVLELTTDGWTTAPERQVLHQAALSVPANPNDTPFLGDYIRMLTVGRDFYGVFAGDNLPDNANFPVGVTYLRRANFVTHQLFDLDGVHRVPPSIDPFFFHRAA
ncbi:hypothetical protein OG689_35925 [Kitasatospora sp. NBC_00240]|uniref:hypothetical protein n=1 Tax=Kitasatospora sp. NBC_00240 TaxID=2903567 RepID=UPI00225465E8|nr:hypothetical protein [Kitasatospora sp. NBC_00240]MCX5214585.1 hypothetical protein [Kitasatospora sp. NBC_00240]